MTAADRELLFGLLAVQNRLIDKAQLVAAFQTWVGDQSKSLGDHLEASGDLTNAMRAPLETLVEIHLEMHGLHPEKSLVAVLDDESTLASLAELDEPKIEATVARCVQNTTRLATGADDVADPDATEAFLHRAGVAEQATVEASQSNRDRQNRELPRITGYEILEVLGAGGMVIVYKARQPRLDRMVALKMIKAGAGARQDDLARFEAEARAVAAIDHPKIIKIFEIGERDGLPYFALEFLEGGSLADRIDGKPQPIDEAARIVEMLARALDLAHRRGIVHRDIKPANILLAGDGTPKIADFGLVKRLEANSTQTGTGSILGSPSYMAPEQVTGTVKVGSRRRPRRARGHALRDAHRPATIPRVINRRHARSRPHRRAGRSIAPSPPNATRPGDDLLKGAAKGSGSTLSRRRRPGRGPPAIPRRRADRRPSRLRPRAALALVPAQPAGRFACSNGGSAANRRRDRVDRGLPRPAPVAPGTGRGQHDGQESPHRGRDRPKTRRRRKEAGHRRRARRHPAEPRSRRGPA